MIPEGAFAKNMEYVGYHDLNGKPGFQMAMQKVGGRYYIYVTGFRHNGFNIIDVTDPASPRWVKWVEGPNSEIDDPYFPQGIPKMQLADGILITAASGLIGFLQGTDDSRLSEAEGGAIIWDVKDPENPKRLSFFKIHGFGVHRFFYNGGRYAYLTGNEKGFDGFIMRIIDIEDPSNPVEVGRWWMSEQYMGDKRVKSASYEEEESLARPYVHALTVKDDIAYLACGVGGFYMLDVSDKTCPSMISRLHLCPPLGGGSGGAPVHSALKLGDRPFVVVTNEGERANYFPGVGETNRKRFPELVTQPMCAIMMVEITDPKRPNLVSIFPYPEVPDDYPHGTNFNFVDGARVPFGPHNLFDAFGPDVYEHDSNRLYCSYFNAGLRAYDVSDPFVPKEIGYFIPPDPSEVLFDRPGETLFPRKLVPLAEDVLVDDRGYIYFDTFSDGLYIVRCTSK